MVGELVKNPEHEREYTEISLHSIHWLISLARAFAVMPFGKSFRSDVERQ
jgi:hypothetical protein